MRNVLLFTASSFLLAGTATGQTTQCQWIGNVWNCDQQRPAPTIQWQNAVMPDVGGNVMRAFEQGRELRRQEERARLEAERLTAERDFYRSQTQITPNQQSQRMVPPQSSPASSYGQAWLAAANQRRHLFNDFDKIVFAPDVKITEEMVMLMSGSPYAADIAYYLGTHKAESLAISRLSLLDAARSIDGIESRVKSNLETGK